MNKKLQIILISTAATPAGLESRVMACVERAARRRSFERIATGSIVSVFFAATLVVIGQQTSAEIATSGFGQYLSLLFSNGGVVMSNWSDFGWTIVESAPITGLALCLGTAGLLVGAVRWTGKAVGGFSATGKLAI